MPPKGMVSLYTMTRGETVIDYLVSEAVAQKQPMWDPSQSPPPLSTVDAVAKARAWLKQKHPKFDAFVPSSINYRQVRYERTNFWYYSISFDGMVGQTRTYAPELDAVVLFDGTVVEPRPGAPRK